ncbi:hypothetical protein ACIQYM_38665 [Rhodococcus erythropolis]
MTSPVAVVVLLVAMALFVIALRIFAQNSTWRSSAATTETLRNLVSRNDAWGMSECGGSAPIPTSMSSNLSDVQ